MPSEPDTDVRTGGSHPSSDRHPVRRVAAIVLVICASLLVPLAAVAVWANRTVAEPEPVVAAVDQVITNPVVIDGIATWITDQVMQAVGPVILDQVPRPMRPVVRAKADLMRTPIHDATVAALSSAAGEQLLLAAARSTHAAAMRVLDQEGLFPGGTATVSNGAVTVNLVPIAGLALVSLQNDGYLLVGSAGAQTITTSAQIATMFGVHLPTDFGQLVVYRSDAIAESGTLTTARDAVATLHRAMVILLAASVAALAAAALVAVDRRTTIMRCALGVAGVTLIGIIVLRAVDDEVGTGISSAVGRLAATALSQQLSASLQRSLVVIELIAVAVAIVALVLGRLHRADATNDTPAEPTPTT